MKIKSNIFSFLLGAVIFGGIVGVSAYTMFASDIGYAPEDTTWKKSDGTDITNVKDAIDELYIKANDNSNVCSDIILSFRLNSKNSDGDPSNVEFDVKNYKSFTITNGFANTNGNRTLVVTYNSQTYTIKYLKSLTLQVVDNVDIVKISGKGTTGGYTAFGKIEKMCTVDNEQ